MYHRSYVRQIREVSHAMTTCKCALAMAVVLLVLPLALRVSTGFYFRALVLVLAILGRVLALANIPHTLISALAN